MKFKTIGNRDGYGLCTPVNKEDMAIFKHCNEGLVCCLKERVFDGDVGALLLAHGVYQIEIIKPDKVKKALGHRYNGDDICPRCGHSKEYAEKNEISCFDNPRVRNRA